ncbi:glycosyltransferase family 1 protein [Pedobacter flavus]|uniref:Glycosyltransferase family 1 protein n=1 Tax=Pedobacter flavus TaxID=3113906 RepID=A0ABU7GYH6_9SPHI|nr:glycosyltransferase family 1 protein [Pedobacter sp. VNH31]MEE1883922.1 glycosyltransferase family 1 protein [Pedobacter sp. VNH31]
MQDQPRILIYFIKPKEKNRFFYGDRYIIPFLRKLFKPTKIGGVEKVFHNLCKSFDKLKVKYWINLPFDKIEPSDQLIILGLGRTCLEGYNKENKIVAGIALMTHPSEWPDLTKNYPISKYLQHSEWAKNVYVPYYGDQICDTWFSGIDTDEWKPKQQQKEIDVLIYDKIRWQDSHNLLEKICQNLSEKNLNFSIIKYGSYNEQDYKKLLENSKSMIFLSSHESQGFACCEALAMDVPVFAWDQGFCLDPNRFKWNDPIMPATSVPFFNEQCGDKFKDVKEFQLKFDQFFKNVQLNKYRPRNYILENLTLEKSGQRMLEILKTVYK